MPHPALRLAALAASLWLPVAATAQEADAEVRALFDALGLPEIARIIAEEGIADGDTLAAEVFTAGPLPSTWDDGIAAIYDADRMESELLASLEASLEGEDVAAMRAFFEGEPGATFIAREVETRRALADPDAEQAAREAAAVALGGRDPRVELLERYVDSLDLVELNVVGTLNSNFAYVSALLDGGAIPGDTSESDILSDVAAQESTIRADTAEWVLAFLLQAYEPLPDADLEALLAFSETEPGQVLNQAIFDAFDARFVEVSRQLGRLAARYMTTEEL